MTVRYQWCEEDPAGRQRGLMSHFGRQRRDRREKIVSENIGRSLEGLWGGPKGSLRMLP